MNYWDKRQQQLNSQLENDEAMLKKRLSSFYDSEYRKLEKEIASYYQQYGEDNVIQYRSLMEALSEGDKKLLIERMKAFAEKYPEYEDLIPIRESIYKLNRLEGLQTSIRMQQLEIGAVNNQALRAHLEKQALRSANSIAELMGFGKNFYSVNSDIVKAAVGVAWSNGKNFSQRIWGNAEKLADYLCTDVAQAIARGDSYDRIARQTKKRFGDVSRNDMYRLIYTEGTFVINEADAKGFEADFDQYQIYTIGDKKVCSICKGLELETFNFKDRQPGVNFPPLHAWCRCKHAPAVTNWDAWMEDYERKHRNRQAEKVKGRLNGDGKDDILSLDSLIPAESIKAAKEDALTKCKLNAYYDKFNLDVANMVNEEIYKAHQIFGDLSSVLYGVKEYPGKMESYARYSPGFKEIYLKNIRAKNALKVMKKDAKYNYDAGYWSTNCAEHAVRHETGHAVAHLFTDGDSTKLDKISQIRKELYDKCVDQKTGWSIYDSKGMEEAKKQLSYYALKSDKEFIAESVAEYMGDNPRETAKKVVDILLGKQG